MDPRVSGIRKNQLSPAFGQRLGGRPVPSAFGTPLSPMVNLPPRAQPALSQLAFNRGKLADIHAEARQPAERHHAQPPVEAHVLSASHSSLTPPGRDAADSGFETTASIKPLDRRWEEVEYGNHSDGSFIRMICTGPKTEPAARPGRIPKFPARQPDVSYQMYNNDGNDIYATKLQIEMWETPEDQDTVIIRRSNIPNESSETLLYPESKEVHLPWQEGSVAATFALCLSDSADDSDTSYEMSYGKPNDQQLYPHLHNPFQGDSMFGEKKHSRNLLALRQPWPESEPLDRGDAKITLRHMSSSKAALHFITYTISEDRSGDSTALLRQVLSALATSQLGETLKPDPRESSDKRAAVRCSLSESSIYHISQRVSNTLGITRPDKKAEIATVSFEKFASTGETHFPESLVCTEAFKQLNISHKKASGAYQELIIVPVALCANWVEQLVWLSRRLSKQIPIRSESKLVIKQSDLAPMSPKFDYCIGDTIIPECVAHKRALTALGYSFRQQGPHNILVEAALSEHQVQVIAEQSCAIEEQALKYALACP